MSRVLLLLLLLASPSLPAQQGGTGAETGPAASTGSADPEPEPAEDANEPDRAAPDRSPFEYESSEQISEDLSVSFPVDI